MVEIPGIVWPPLAQSEQRPLPALLQQLGQLERAPLEELAAGQQQQLGVLTFWLAQHSVFHQRRLQAANLALLQPLTLDTLANLPPMTRRELQSGEDELFCEPPPSHQPVTETRTSGSSGESVVVLRTQISHLFWLAYGMRDHLWWRRDFSGKLAIIRANLSQERISLNSWGPPASLLTTTGPGHAFSMAMDTATQARLLVNIDPHYLLTYPNNLAELLRYIESDRLSLPSLLQIRSIGETLPSDLRDETRRVLGVEIVDTYSSQEVGVIAIQCPASGLYHLMAENLIVEVLNEQGVACLSGETGDVVVTDLHNFATPLIRYAIGDRAEVGPPCICGRNLPTLSRILGRSRNMVLFPDGTRRWPIVGFYRYREIAPVIQYQLVQRSRQSIDVNLVVERPLVPQEEIALADVIRENIGYPFNIQFIYHPHRIPVSKGGKFEEFVCELTT